MRGSNDVTGLLTVAPFLYKYYSGGILIFEGVQPGS